MSHKSLIAYANQCNELEDFVYELRNQYTERKNVENPASKQVTFLFRESVDVDTDALIQHIDDSIRGMKSFDFTIRCATTIFDHIAGCNIALVPDEGLSHLLKIAVSVSKGIFLKGLGYEGYIPDVVIPFINIRWIRTHRQAQTIVEEINKQSFAYHGRINSLRLFEHSTIDNKWNEIYEFKLTGNR